MGSNDSTQKNQLNLQNQLQAQQQAKQDALLQQNQTALSPYLSGNIGYTPAQLASLNTSVLSQNAQKYNAAAQQTNAQLAARGENGQTPLSGVAATGYGNLNAARASDLSSGLNTVVQNNAQQALANQFNAASVLSGNAQTYAGNVGTYGSGASNALNNVTQAQSNGFLNNFAKSLGSGFGAVGTALTGGAAGSGLSSAGSAGTPVTDDPLAW
jgi:hypothetical protein